MLDEALKQVTDEGPPEPVSKDIGKKSSDLNNFDDITNNDNKVSKVDVDEEEEIIKGLSNFSIDSKSGDEETLYLSKGPVFRRNEINYRLAPYQMEQPKLQQQALQVQIPQGETLEELLEAIDVSLLDSTKLFDGQLVPKIEEAAKVTIPTLPGTNIYGQAQGSFDVKEVDPKFVSKHPSLYESRILLKKLGGGFIILPHKVRVTADTASKKLGVQLPKVVLPADALRERSDVIDVLFQPNPRDERIIYGEAKFVSIKTENGQSCCIIMEQFMELAPFTMNGRAVMSVFLESVTKDDIDNAVELVGRQNSEDIFKAYGPNNDTMLMTLCCKKDDTPTIRAQVFALSARILNESDDHLRSNIVMKNESKLSALDYTTITNNARLAIYLAKLIFILGHDVLCTDSAGNTILHVMARKGDCVSLTLEALLSLRFNDRARNGGKVFSSKVANNKGFLPIHIAAMAAKCPQNTIRILRADNENGFYERTNDGSLPLHIACQYSTDPALVATLLYYYKPHIVNERRGDGITPLHLVAARSNIKNAKEGIFPLDETSQVRMIKLLLEHGADRDMIADGMKPVEVVSPDRVEAMTILKHYNAKAYESGSLEGKMSPPQYGNSSPCQISCGDDVSPYSTQLSPSNLNDPFLGSNVYNGDSPNPYTQIYTWQSSPSASSYTSSTQPGSVSTVERFSDESDEDNNAEELDAIAQALIAHPSIQAAIDAATRMN